ncbi:MAG: hypothetical protein V1770_03570 [bacterium]
MAESFFITKKAPLDGAKRITVLPFKNKFFLAFFMSTAAKFFGLIIKRKQGKKYDYYGTSFIHIEVR